MFKYLGIICFILLNKISISQDFDYLISTKQFVKAEEMMLNSKELDKRIMMVKLGDAYFEAQQYSKAAKHYLLLNDKERIKKIASKYGALNNPQKALYYYKKADEIATGYKIMAEHFITKQMPDSSEKYTRLYATTIAEKDNILHELVKNNIQLYLKSKQYSKAIQLTNDLAHVPNKAILANGLFADKLYVESFQYRNYVENKIDFNNQLGLKLHEIGKLNEAQECFRIANNTSKINEISIELAKRHVKNGNIDEAEKLFIEASASELGNKTIGDYYYSKKQYEAANAYYLRLAPTTEYYKDFEKMITQMELINNYAAVASYKKKLNKSEEAEIIIKKIFINNDNGTISSTELPIIWEEKQNGPMDWLKANEYCEKLVLAGHADWQLPDNIAYMNTIIKAYQNNKNLLSDYFDDINEKTFWTANKFGGHNGKEQHYSISIKEKEQQEVKNGTENLMVRCIRTFSQIEKPIK